MYLGSDRSQQIYYAKKYWTAIGISATVFLIFTTYLGWQYQHRLRRRFFHLVARIGSSELIVDNVEDETGGET
jgi:hypothetical protein